MFQQVDVPHLQLNQTYKILANNYVFKGRFKGFRYFDEIKLTFEPSPHLSLEFDKVHNISRSSFHPYQYNIYTSCISVHFAKSSMEHGASHCQYDFTTIDW